MDTDSNTASDQDQAPAIAADNTTPPEAEIIELDFSGEHTSDQDEWVNVVAVLSTWDERELLERLFNLNRDIGISLDAASNTDCPKAMKTHLHNAASALKSALVAIKALDRHRHGSIQRIVVEYRDTASLTLKTFVRDPRFAQSDEIIDDLFSRHVENFGSFESRCRKESMTLSRATPEELRAKRYGHRPEPDRSTWEPKFRGLASWLAGQTVTFLQALKARHTRGQQHILVDRTGNVPLAKLRAKTALPPDGADTPLEVCKPAEPTPVVPFIKKASREGDCATA